MLLLDAAFFNMTRIMKTTSTLLLIVLASVAYAQTPAAKAPAGNCYSDWYSIFKDRGAKPIPDGMQEVIIAFRSANYQECFLGKIDILGGKVNGRLQVQKTDGTYEEWDKRVHETYFDSNGSMKNEKLLEIHNGMTAEFLVTEGEYARLFFYKYVADKPKANKKAPSPAALVKN
jgi:hypothetical protein